MPAPIHRFPLPARLAVLSAASVFAGLLALWLSGGGSVSYVWSKTMELNISFELDGLGALYGLVASGVGIVVFAFAGGYLPRHLAEAGRSPRDNWRFFALMTLFLFAMVGLATAQDLILLFLFWDVTAVASYFLIGFDRERIEARSSALLALLITCASALLLLVGSLMLFERYGTFSIPELIRVAEPGTHLTIAGALIAVAALAKSAQVPLHFWLPRAMEAPTPVSAYLHSAAMVAAGVFLISRVHALLADSAVVMDGLVAVGVMSIIAGSTRALTADPFKRLLAYSTISQYGYVVVLLGLGTQTSAVAACFYVIAHALAKAALFLTAGAVSSTTGRYKLSEVGGLWRSSPWLAAGAGLAAAGLGALPLTIGFFKDELFFNALIERGTGWAICGAVAAAMSLAYAMRFWTGIFIGPLRLPGDAGLRFAPVMVVPVVVLGALVLTGGLWPAAVSSIAQDAGAAMLAPASASVAYHLDLRSANVLALGAWAGAALLLFTQAAWSPLLARLTALTGRIGPERIYRDTVRSLDRLSDAAHDLELRDLRVRLAAILVPGTLLIALGVFVTPFAGSYRVGTIETADIPLLMTLTVTAVAAVASTITRNHLMLVLMLSALGFSLAVTYGFFGSPDVALVAVLVETVLLLIFLGILVLMPDRVLRREAMLRRPANVAWRNAWIAAGSGLAMFFLAWAALSRPALAPSVSEDQIALTPSAHGKDIVTVILADFRGLDTLVEVSVVLVAAIAIATLLRRGRLA